MQRRALALTKIGCLCLNSAMRLARAPVYAAKDRAVAAREHAVSDPTTITTLEARDIRFPTSRSLDGSDAMHTDPDYSAAYVVLRTDAGDGLEGHGLTFTIGRGTEVVRRRDRTRSRRSSSAARSRRSPPTCAAFWREPHLRQPAALARPGEGRDPPRDGRGRQRGLGSVGEARGQAALEAARRPDARRSSSRCVDFRYIDRRARRRTRRSTLLRDARRGARPSARRELARVGYPAYTTSAGWLGYADDKVAPARARGASRRASRTSR